jgi:hypothetical protein
MNGGTRSSTVAVTIMWVSPSFRRHEPSANLEKFRSKEKGRS